MKAVADALAKSSPDDPGTSGGKLLTVLVTARSYTSARPVWTVYLAVRPDEQLGTLLNYHTYHVWIISRGVLVYSKGFGAQVSCVVPACVWYERTLASPGFGHARYIV